MEHGINTLGLFAGARTTTDMLWPGTNWTRPLGFTGWEQMVPIGYVGTMPGCGCPQGGMDDVTWVCLGYRIR